MIEITTFLKGLAVGLLVVIPVGPVGVLCIQRTLDKGKLSGFISGLGAATADVFYASVAAFGLVIIIDFLRTYQTIIQLIGVSILLYIGIKSFYYPKKENNSIEKGTDMVTDFFSTMLLTATNPTIIMTFTVLFAMTTSGFSSGSYDLATILVIGVFLGASLWWLILCLGIGQIKKRVKNFSLEIIDKISGIVTILFAIIVLISVILK